MRGYQTLTSLVSETLSMELLLVNFMTKVSKAGKTEGNRQWLPLPALYLVTRHNAIDEKQLGALLRPQSFQYQLPPLWRERANQAQHQLVRCLGRGA